MDGINLERHHALTSSNDVQGICDSVLSSIGITYFNYIKIYHHDCSRELLTNNSYWIDHFYKNSLYNSVGAVDVEHLLPKGYFLWSEMDEKDPIYLQGRDFFNIDHGISFVIKRKDITYLYIFASNKGRHEINNFYVNNIDLLQRPDIQVKAITIVANGSAHCLPAKHNIYGLLQLAKKHSIPIACGINKPLFGEHHFPASIVNESDTLAGTAKLLSHTKLDNQQNAIDLIIKIIQETSEPLTILAIGSLTNIAQALQKAPQIKNHIQSIYIMGGAIKVQGNIPVVEPTIKNFLAEWNIYIDPIAASIVLKQKVPIVLVPLDVTNQLPINMHFYNQLTRYHRATLIDYVFAILKNNSNMILNKGWYFWDPLAAVIASDESMADFQTQPIKVILAPETQSGALAIDTKAGSNIRVVTHVDQKSFETTLLHYLNAAV